MTRILSTTQSNLSHIFGKAQVPPIIIALRLERAAAAIDVSEDYLSKAIKEGRLKATVKKAPGKGRGIMLITVEELKRFAETNEGDDLPEAQ